MYSSVQQRFLGVAATKQFQFIGACRALISIRKFGVVQYRNEQTDEHFEQYCRYACVHARNKTSDTFINDTQNVFQYFNSRILFHLFAKRICDVYYNRLGQLNFSTSISSSTRTCLGIRIYKYFLR